VTSLSEQRNSQPRNSKKLGNGQLQIPSHPFSQLLINVLKYVDVLYVVCACPWLQAGWVSGSRGVALVLGSVVVAAAALVLGAVGPEVAATWVLATLAGLPTWMLVLFAVGAAGAMSLAASAAYRRLSRASLAATVAAMDSGSEVGTFTATFFLDRAGQQ
jgi:hypothetical protein